MGGKTRTLPQATLVALIFVVLLGAVTPIRAQGLDSASAAALAETLKALANPNGSSLPLGNDASGAEIDRQMRSIAGSPQLAQEVYGLAARVLAELVQSTGGDVGEAIRGARAGEVRSRRLRGHAEPADASAAEGIVGQDRRRPALRYPRRGPPAFTPCRSTTAIPRAAQAILGGDEAS